MSEDKEDSRDDLPRKSASWDEVFRYALERYKGNSERASKFCRGWFSCGEQMKLNKEKKD